MPLPLPKLLESPISIGPREPFTCDFKKAEGIYLPALDLICEQGVYEGKASTVLNIDINAIRAIADRVNLAKSVVDFKLALNPDGKNCSTDEERLGFIVNKEVEKYQRARAIDYGSSIGLNEQEVTRVMDGLINTTVNLEVDYLRSINEA